MSIKDSMKKRQLAAIAPVPVVAVPKPPRAVHTKEFKLAALARMRDGAQNPTALAMELGIRRNQLYKWAKLFDAGPADGGFKGPGRPPAAQESEVSRLRRDLKIAKEELAIQKKFNAYLARLK